MEKAKPFEDYFADERLGDDKLARMQLTRQIVHELYPEVKEQVSYAMPGFYPQKATKATQQLFLLMANKDWLGLYGTQGMSEEELSGFLDKGISLGKGSIQVPYDMDEADFRQLLAFVIQYNSDRHGLK